MNSPFQGCLCQRPVLCTSRGVRQAFNPLSLSSVLSCLRLPLGHDHRYGRYKCLGCDVLLRHSLDVQSATQILEPYNSGLLLKIRVTGSACRTVHWDRLGLRYPVSTREDGTWTVNDDGQEDFVSLDILLSEACTLYVLSFWLHVLTKTPQVLS